MPPSSALALAGDTPHDAAGRLLFVGGDHADDPVFCDSEGWVTFKGVPENPLVLPPTPPHPHRAKMAAPYAGPPWILIATFARIKASAAAEQATAQARRQRQEERAQAKFDHHLERCHDPVEERLYLTAARPPPDLVPNQARHKCSIRWGVKAHPVGYDCSQSLLCVHPHMAQARALLPRLPSPHLSPSYSPVW
ncbi:hypothetical protein C8R43DRAFT_1117308 [Mycena crocata]|nr:hypothetical protein C8R43DRAFT_1117308 [Mycena crocata]